MRGLVPVDMQKATLKTMMTQGVPETIARRIIDHKALWMITMHPEDVAKVCICVYRLLLHYLLSLIVN